MEQRILKYTISCFLALSVLSPGCRERIENKRLMEQAALLAEQNPDSAVILLDAVNPVTFGSKQQAEYDLLRVQAKDNAGRDIAVDTEIFRARDYFIEKKGNEKAALACFYAAKAVAAKGDDASEMQYYHEALKYVEKTDDVILKGRILNNLGYLSYSKRWYDEAVILYRQALKCFRSARNQYNREVRVLNAMANAMLLNRQTDSAQYYYRTAMDLARLHGNPALQDVVFNDMGVAYRAQQQYDTAKYCFAQALRLMINDHEKAVTRINLAYVSLNRNEIDSARHYLKTAEPLFSGIENLEALANLTELRYQVEKSVGNYSQALELNELYTQYLYAAMEKDDRRMLLEMQKKYDWVSAQNEHSRVITFWWIVAGGLCICISTLAVAAMAAQKKSMRRKAALEKAEQEMYTLQEMCHRYSEKDNMLQAAFLKKMGLIGAFALLNKHSRDNLPPSNLFIKNANSILAKLDRNTLVETVNELRPGFIDELKTLNCDLTEQEIDICGLSLFGFNNDELAFFMGKSAHSVLKWKNSIRTKLNIAPYRDIAEFLHQNLVKLTLIELESAKKKL